MTIWNKFFLSVLFLSNCTGKVAAMYEPMIKEESLDDYKDVSQIKLLGKSNYLRSILMRIAASLEAHEETHTIIDVDSLQMIYKELEIIVEMYKNDRVFATTVNRHLDKLSLNERQDLFNVINQIGRAWQKVTVSDPLFKDDLLNLYRTFENIIVKRIPRPAWYHHIIYANALTKFSVAVSTLALSYIVYDKLFKKVDSPQPQIH